jgi:hypothetical protein
VSKIYPPLEDPVSRRGELKLGAAFLSRRFWREILNQNLYFEMAYGIFQKAKEQSITDNE